MLKNPAHSAQPSESWTVCIYTIHKRHATIAIGFFGSSRTCLSLWLVYHKGMKSLFPRSLRHILLYQTLFAAFMLFSALTGQYAFDLHPCDLCIYQRYPYFAILAFGLLGYRLAQSDKLALSLVILCIVLLLVDSGIAFYHTGVEYGWFAGPDACSNADAGEMTLEQMRAAIMGAPLVTCSQAMAYILGLSMAAWNTMMAFGAAVLSIIAMRKVL